MRQAIRFLQQNTPSKYITRIKNNKRMFVYFIRYKRQNNLNFLDHNIHIKTHTLMLIANLNAPFTTPSLSLAKKQLLRAFNRAVAISETICKLYLICNLMCCVKLITQYHNYTVQISVTSPSFRCPCWQIHP